MQEYESILDKTKLQDNIRFAALFIMNFECLKDYLVSQMRGFFCDSYSEIDGQFQIIESKEYLDIVKKLDPKRNKLTAALAWYKELGAINQDDIDLFYRSRNRRNSITHEFAQELLKGFSEHDYDLFNSMLNFYRKLDKWWIVEMEIPFIDDEILEQYDQDKVVGGQAAILTIINDVAMDKEDAFESLRALLGDKN